jgi:uncharacterized protein YjbI with pentapeptide repeats
LREPTWNNLSGAKFRASEMVDTRFRGVEMSGVVMRGVALFDVDIYGGIGNLTINGADEIRAYLTTIDNNR